MPSPAPAPSAPPTGAPAPLSGYEVTRSGRWWKIHRAALDLFEQHGYGAVSVEQIAGAAGVSRRTFFNYFPTKAAVLFDPEPTLYQRLTALLESFDPEIGTWAILAEALTMYVAGDGYAVATVRRRILCEDPKLDAPHHAANRHFDDAIRAWLSGQESSAQHGALLSALALAVVNTAFYTWDPDTGRDEFERLLRSGFDYARPATQPPAG